MDQERERTRKDGGLMPLAALAATLLIGGLGAALPKPAMEGARPSRSPLVDLSLSMPQIAQASQTPAPAGARTGETHASFGPVSRARSPATLPPDTPAVAQRRHGGRE